MAKTPPPVPTRVTLERADKKVFASALDWPGWSRSGKTDEMALETLASYAPRYAMVAELAGLSLPPDANRLEVVEEVLGGSGTVFGVPSVVTPDEHRAVTAGEAQRLAAIVRAAWETFDRVAAAAPPELRKGPRGGGRDRDKMVGHVIESDAAYARALGLKLRPATPVDRKGVEAMRAEVLEVLGRTSDGSPVADRRWTTRYAARRIAWHALDHAWEMEDRTER